MKTKPLTLRLYRDKKREFRWTLISPNGRKLANSGESYKRRGAMEKAVFTALTGRGDQCWRDFCEIRRSDIRVEDQTILA